MNKPLIIIGCGGHASVLEDILISQNRYILGYTDDRPLIKYTSSPILGNQEKVLEYQPDQIKLVNGIGSVGYTKIREYIFRKFKKLGYTFETIIHPSAIIATKVVIEEGGQIMAGTVIQPGVIIGANSIINTKTSVDHDCVIGKHVHLAPGVTLSGNVHVERRCHVGTGATVIQGIHIGEAALIGAGALVNKNVMKGTKVIGVPAKEAAKGIRYQEEPHD
ncbi:acetyltransferase [Metabacillus idriensis]|uniref:acetyltransferase n=1 Tax=Metabacillus idriensis TaxID=324768 RepID=UPI0028140A71|nr:acetyltransferase [Metabacillus idriensis]MDR0138027.1 acetyltransferase [Metabacillus idriensis]